MPALANRILRSRLAGALPPTARLEGGPEDVHPVVAEVPGFGRARFYLWTVTADRSAQGRPAGEFKIQLILPGQPRGARASLDLDGAYTALLGYSPEYGVFVGWEARLYTNFAYSRNVQCREDLLQEARNAGWAVAAPRAVGETEEVRVAFTPGNLLHFLRTSRSADNEGRTGVSREAYLLARTPNAEAAVPQRNRDLEDFVQRQRERVTAARWARNARFSASVKLQYRYACAVCSVQLEIIEGAHIIPVSEEGSSDSVWNGIALCANHHSLFDGSAFVVRPDLEVRVDEERVEYLQANDLADGIEILTNYHRRPIRRPEFWNNDQDKRDRMIAALSRRVSGSGFG
ncbi:MAG: HNH endonuclease [Betaproteobacteria bacterium]